MGFSLFGGTRDAQWKAVDEAVRKGLPRSAITNLEPIIAAAMKEKAYAEAVKATGKKIALEMQIEGNLPEQGVRRLEAALANSPAEVKPVMETLLAHAYWNYFQRYRWRFMNRTATAQAPGQDFTTWDLPRLFAEIDKHFQAGIAAEKALKATPISAWNDLLPKGTMPDAYRPTLYDFLAYEALSFYTAGEQAAAKPEDSFEVAADGPVFDPPEKFIQWQPAATDTNSPALRALRVYQELLRFHRDDPAPRLAFAHADLERLSWAWNTAFGESKDARYKAALETFIRANADSDTSAFAYEDEARVLQREGEWVAAHKLASRGVELYPDSPGGKLCRNLVNEIEAKSVAISTEKVWNCSAEKATGPCPTITVNYRNIDKVYLRAIPYDWESLKQAEGPEALTQDEQRELLKRPPALEWSETLPPTADYKEKSLALPAPKNLKPGFYFVAASHNPQFTEEQNLVATASVWVSDLSLIIQTRNGLIEGFVLDADSGEPLPDARIDVWHRDDRGKRVADPAVSTDENGFFSFIPRTNTRYLFRAHHHGREVANQYEVWAADWMRQREPRPSARTVFFTDRALYRPGQTIQYKGICLWVDASKDNYELLKGEDVTVSFRDASGKEIAQQKHRANAYGSFAGSFTAPRDRLMGRMSLQALGRAPGNAAVRVEEYKRPKFEVKLEAPKPAAKLNEKVSLKGSATSYTGAAVDGAQVRFRVTRQVRWPIWRWWHPPSSGDGQEIAHGTLRTGTDGSFQVEFLARPDPMAPEKDDPIFTFQVNADVTDTAGETRSDDRDVRAGYTALEATASADDWQVDQKPVEVTIHTQTLDAEPQVAEGSLKVYALQPPSTVQRGPLEEAARPYGRYWMSPPPRSPSEPGDLSNPRNWPLGPVAAEGGFTTDTNGTVKLSFKLATGAYRAVLATQDRFGKKVSFELSLLVLSPNSNKLAIRVPHVFNAPEWETQPGQEFVALWGTGYETGRALVQIEHRQQIIRRFWTAPGRTQEQIKLAVTEAMRGGFTLHVTQVRENRAYTDSRRVEVPWKNKELNLTWEHFVSKLQPGQKETWTIAIRPNPGVSGAGKLAAELAATLYDESLDAFAAHQWLRRFDIFRADFSDLQPHLANGREDFRHVLGDWNPPWENVEISYRSFPSDLVLGFRGYPSKRARGVAMAGRAGGEFEMAVERAQTALNLSAGYAFKAVPATAPAALALGDPPALGAAFHPVSEPAGQTPASKPDLGQVAARKNLNETAFFFPQLTSDSNGVVRLSFTMPEALTRWRFMGFAHDGAVRSGYLEDHAVTAKDLMVQPNPPRFLREGDTVEFTVKVSNQSEKPQRGTVRLSFNQALDNSPADKLLNLTAVPANRSGTDQVFDIPAKESRTFSWRLTVPDGCGFLTYKAVGAASNVSDGEEGAVPVLSRRILVTESLPLPIRGPATKKFEFTRLLKSGDSKTLRHQGLTVQMVSNPAWYAVLALPYLIEYPYECSEQVFNRLYANALARSIANGDPKIRRVFDQWKNTPALDSPLEKNQDLKAVALEETPWVRQAEAETQARHNVGVLFDDNRLNTETDATLRKLVEMQLPDGLWPWFPGGLANEYITLYIVTGFGRMRHLGVDVNVQPALRSLQKLDAWMTEEYERIQKQPEPGKYVPSPTVALYLYGRSFFLKDTPVAAKNKPALEFFLAQARKFWLETGSRQTQGHLALALHRFNAFNRGADTTPAAIMRSLKERSVTNEEMGRFWRDTELSWWWYRAPIETQALMIEAFDEVAGDKAAVEDCRVWLLKQKQTQDWKTTKATADAVYALLLRGRDILSSDSLVEIKLDGIDLTPRAAPASARKRSGGAREPARGSESRPAPEAGTGFYEVRFAPAEIKPKLGEITVKKLDQGVAWGSVHWQYLEDMAKVTPYEDTPLQLKKSLYLKTATSRGPVLELVRGPVKVGDELVVRVELRTDRDMEYVHLKDQRGSGTEPVNVLSRYRYQDGLGYYESTRDTATHFFIDYLRKGTHVFEYSTRVQLRGQYQTGVAQIQCMYAPEFNSHSQSIPITVK